MTFGEFFSNIGQAINKLGSLFLDTQMSDFFINVVLIFVSFAFLAIIFFIIRFFFKIFFYQLIDFHHLKSNLEQKVKL